MPTVSHKGLLWAWTDQKYVQPPNRQALRLAAYCVVRRFVRHTMQWRISQVDTVTNTIHLAFGGPELEITDYAMAIPFLLLHFPKLESKAKNHA